MYFLRNVLNVNYVVCVINRGGRKPTHHYYCHCFDVYYLRENIVPGYFCL